MELKSIANVLSTDEFESKDKKNIYRNVTVIIGDLVIPFKFVKKEVYDTCKAVGRLGFVELTLHIIQTGTDSNGNPTYGFRCSDCIVAKNPAEVAKK